MKIKTSSKGLINNITEMFNQACNGTYTIYMGIYVNGSIAKSTGILPIVVGSLKPFNTYEYHIKD